MSPKKDINITANYIYKNSYVRAFQEQIVGLVAINPKPTAINFQIEPTNIHSDHKQHS